MICNDAALQTISLLYQQSSRATKTRSYTHTTCHVHYNFFLSKYYIHIFTSLLHIWIHERDVSLMMTSHKLSFTVLSTTSIFLPEFWSEVVTPSGLIVLTNSVQNIWRQVHVSFSYSNCFLLLLISRCRPDLTWREKERREEESKRYGMTYIVPHSIMECWCFISLICTFEMQCIRRKKSIYFLFFGFFLL